MTSAQQGIAVVKEVATVHSTDVVLPVKTEESREGRAVRPRVVARPTEAGLRRETAIVKH